MGVHAASRVRVAAAPILVVVVVLLLAMASTPRAQDVGDERGLIALTDVAVGNASLALPKVLPAVADPPPEDVSVQRRRHNRGRRGRRPHNPRRVAPADTLELEQAPDRPPRRERHRRKKGHHQGMERKHHVARNEESNKKRRNKKIRNNEGAPQGHARGLGGEAGEAGEALHRKQRQSRRKGAGRRRSQATTTSMAAAAATSSSPGVGEEYSTATFHLRSEEKRELVGRRTLQVLSPGSAVSRGPSPPSPTLVGILDIPAATPSSSAATAMAVAPGRHAPDRRRADTAGDAVYPSAAKPLDADWLQRLLAAAALTSAKAAKIASDQTEDDEVDTDAAPPSPCDRWISCSAKLKSAIRAQLSALPACPCSFPANVFYYNKIWDNKHARYFRWRDASGRGEKLEVYHPGASYCIRSASTGMLAAQHCCYDRNRQLLTRGSGAGTPALVSPDVSAVLHDTLDVRPWRICKGDFTRYNELRPPNNENNCPANPDNAEFQRQKDLSQFY